MQRWPEQFLNILLPHRCQQCGLILGEAHALCSDCWPKVQFINAPFCACCGLPFPLDYGAGGGDILCARCLADPPPFAAARAAMVYDDASKPMILKFKHGDQLYLAPTFARWMQRMAENWFVDSPLLIPVPLHRHRLFLRRYNQSALLARALAKLYHCDLALNALQRHRATPSQGGLTREQRIKNVTGAFSIRLKYRDMLRGKKIILVDDVLTTGATVSVCAETLLRGGAAEVRVLTLMRVV